VSAASPALPSAAELFAQANQARRGGDAGRASTLYRALEGQYPGSAEAELSRVTLATLLLDSGDPSHALLEFERYLAGPSRTLEAEALVGRARALQRLGRTSEERLAWQEVNQRFPRSVYARQAAERLTALGLRP
jgi:outer membrane protein assembly factor BamD (BamD/ComL family)